MKKNIHRKTKPLKKQATQKTYEKQTKTKQYQRIGENVSIIATLYFKRYCRVSKVKKNWGGGGEGGERSANNQLLGMIG